MTDEGAKKQLEQQLNDIRGQLGIKGVVSQEMPQPNKNTQQNTVTNTSEINIKINLDDSLKENLKGKRALLYVYSKQPTGMPMPIAVVRQPLEQIVKGFPIEISMNDGNSLQPTRKLSDFKQIKIGARISFTGNAMPQAGDLQSDEVLVDMPYSKVVELNIDKVR
jgi:cytochrome c-type biogenesis protein CcmH